MTSLNVARIMVVGAGGFVGEAICRKALEAGHVVGSFSRSRHPNCGVTRLGSEFTAAKIARDIKEFKADLIVHAAGGASVSLSVENPEADRRNSLLPWEEVLDGLRMSASKAPVVQVGSAAVYGQPKILPVPETAACYPVSPYGQHRLECESVGARYAVDHSLRILSARVFSVFGPGQRKLLIWELLRQAMSRSESIIVRGTGRETRDFAFIDDVATGLLRLGLNLINEPTGWRSVNVASGVETSVETLANVVQDVVGSRKDLIFQGQSSPADPQRWQADTRLMKTLVPDWNVGSLEEGLSVCVDAWSPDRVAQ